MGLFTGANHLTPSGNRNPQLPVGFKGTVSVVKAIEVNGTNGDAVVIEMKVVTSNTDQVKVGEVYSWYHSMKFRENAMRKLLTFLYAAMGLDIADDKEHIAKNVAPNNEKLLNEMVEKNALKGAELQVVALAGKDESGKYANLNFSCVGKN